MFCLRLYVAGDLGVRATIGFSSQGWLNEVVPAPFFFFLSNDIRDFNDLRDLKVLKDFKEFNALHALKTFSTNLINLV